MRQSCGDLLILFQPDCVPASGRLVQLAWELLQQPPNTWIQPACAEWKGFPCQVLISPEWHILVLGEPIAWLISANIGEDDVTKQVCNHPGSFLVFGYHRSDQTWHAWTDRLGTLHAYHAWGGQRAALGTFSPAVAAAISSRSLDWEALAGWFAFGFFPADRTHTSDVRILRPASHYVFDRNGRILRQVRYWDWHYNPDVDRTYTETVDQFGELFGRVMAEALAEGRVALPLSGGLDSRSTLAALPAEAAASGRIWSYSYGYTAQSVETRIARQLANARQIPFQAYTIQPYLFDQMEPLLAYTEGFQDVTQARQMAVRDEIAVHTDTLIAALWGDVWLDEMGLSNQPDADEIQVLQHTLKKISKPAGWLLQNLVQPQLGKTSIQPLLESFVQAELQPLFYLEDPDFRVKAYKTEQWSFRWSIPPTRIFQSAGWPRKVFYDARLVDFFTTIPSSYLVGRRLQVDYLKRFALDLARVRWQVYDANLYHYQNHHSWLLPRRAAKKAWRVLTRQPVIERNWEVQYLCPSGRAGLEYWLLRPGLKLHDLLHPCALQTLLDGFFAAPLPSGAAYSLSMLLTFSAWLECYG